MNVAIIGGGAAGYFAAISCKRHHPDAHVTIYEKSSKTLAKVKVSGGGRCNVTHNCESVSQLIKNYPRGGKELKKAFYQFGAKETIHWFKNEGVILKTEKDGRIFPITDSSETIIDCFENLLSKYNIKKKLNTEIKTVSRFENGFKLITENKQNYFAQRIIVTTGGLQKIEKFNWLSELNHKIEKTVPSLFTFNMPNESIKSLQGITVSDVQIKVQGTKLQTQGTLLVTHWGMSGPVILKLSAWGARIFNEKKYNFSIQVRWTGNLHDDEILNIIYLESINYPTKKIKNKNPFDIPNRLWEFLIQKIELNGEYCWNQLSKKNRNKLVNVLSNDIYQVEGKTTFKEEFVTCGGISLKEVNLETFESKKVKKMYFAGEILDVDGVTGGFNFQNAWTTGFIAGKLE